MSIIKLIGFESFEDGRGSLVSLEANNNIPFEIKRVYYMCGMETDRPRGFHAHKKLKQVLVCLSGKCKVILDNGHERESVWLDSPDTGLVVEDMIWREMHDFSENCVLMVLADEYYSESDYIRDYKDFTNQVVS